MTINFGFLGRIQYTYLKTSGNFRITLGGIKSWNRTYFFGSGCIHMLRLHYDYRLLRHFIKPTRLQIIFPSLYWQVLKLLYAIDRPPLWSSGQSSWLQPQSSRVRLPALPDILGSSGSGTGSTQPGEDKLGVTWNKSSSSGLENWD
jgi:hypothetical protein